MRRGILVHVGLPSVQSCSATVTICAMVGIPVTAVTELHPSEQVIRNLLSESVSDGEVIIIDKGLEVVSPCRNRLCRDVTIIDEGLHPLRERSARSHKVCNTADTLEPVHTLIVQKFEALHRIDNRTRDSPFAVGVLNHRAGLLHP